MTDLRVAGQEYSVEEAMRVLAGYAFGRVSAPQWWGARSQAYGQPPDDQSAALRWAYRSYDCIPPEPGGLRDWELLVPAGLNGQLTVKRILQMRTVLADVNAALAQIERGTRLWELPRDEIADPAEHSQGWWIGRARWLLRCASGRDAWVTSYKVLHHKRPEVFPLLDRRTWGYLTRNGGAWLQIHDDLNAQRAAFERLETWFADQAAASNAARCGR